MKRLITLIVFLCALLTFVRSSSAHVLQTDGTIGAVMHIDPDDDPVIGQTATFFFEFKDTTNRFNPSVCDCNVSIDRGGKQIYTQALFEQNGNPSLTSPSFSYIFSQKDIYTVKVTGNPTTPNAFQRFVLSYDIRIDRELASGTITSGKGNGDLYRVIAIVVIAIVFIVLIFSNRNKRKVSGRKIAVILLLIGTVTLLHFVHSSQLLLQLEHHSHHSSQEHPCCMSQLSETYNTPYSVPAQVIVNPNVFRSITATIIERFLAFNIRSPPVNIS